MIEKKVAIFLDKHEFEFIGKSIAIGVSGGPDSLALLHFLWKQRENWDLNIVAVHVDHMFRGEESLQDALFVRDFCQKREIAFEMKRIDVPAYIKSTRKSSQLAARELRYQFFSEVVERNKLDHLVLAHHGDDQIETILMRLTRGSSEKARAGIPFKRPFANGSIIRPFLCLTKADLERYCMEHQIVPRLDPSNEKEVYSRNRFRKHVLPFLKKENSHVHEHFQRFSEELEIDEEYLSELTAIEMNKVMEKRKDKITLDIESFLAIPMSLQRRGIKLILSYLYGEHTTSLSAVHTESIYSIIRRPHPSGSLDFPNGIKIIRSYGYCHFELNSTEFKPFYLELHGPGVVELPNGEKLEVSYITDETEIISDARSFLIDIEKTGFPLIVRTRKAGDRMTLKGMSGTRKLKDIFIDAKVPIIDRNRWPVITDRCDHILWLPNLKKSSVTVESSKITKLLKLTILQ